MKQCRRVSLWLLFLAVLVCLGPCHSFSSTKVSPTVSLQSVATSQVAVLDGAEWASIQSQQLSQDQPTRWGYMTVVVGQDENGQRIVGMQANDNDNNKSVYQESLAKLPTGVSDQDAIATYIMGLSAVHAVRPQSQDIGGSPDSLVSGKVVVVGGNELACFAARGLASLGLHVCLVSAGNPKLKSNAGTIDILKPAIGSSGFAEHIGTFDALLDTVSNERPLRLSPIAVEDNDDEDPFASPLLGSKGSVLDLLKTRHHCETYVSTVTHAQKIIEDEGVFGGPKKAEEYTQNIGSSSFYQNNRDCQSITPPPGLGSTLETLFKKGILFSASNKQKMHQKSETLRGWTLADFWESTTWPQDTSGSAQVRYGLPVLDDSELEDRFAETLQAKDAKTRQERIAAQIREEEPIQVVQDNPFVHQVADIAGLKADIMDPQKDCLLFLSARFCRTCKTIQPQYTRMARLGIEQTESNLLFAKAEASGVMGKELGRYLQVDAVPAFLLFRQGERFGSPISVSRLPSRKLERAVELLESGAAWDPSVLQDPANDES